MLCSGLHTACTSWNFFSDLLLLHAKHSPFYMYWRIYRKPNSSLVLKVITKKSAKQENLSLFMNIILWNGKMRVENQTKTRVWEDSSLCPETLTKNVVQEFHLWTRILTDSVGNFSLVYGCHCIPCTQFHCPIFIVGTVERSLPRSRQSYQASLLFQLVHRGFEPMSSWSGVRRSKQKASKPGSDWWIS